MPPGQWWYSHEGETTVTHLTCSKPSHPSHVAGALLHLHQQAAQHQGCREVAEEPLPKPFVCQSIALLQLQDPKAHEQPELTGCAPAAQLSETGQQKDCNIHRSLKISDVGDKGSDSTSISHEVNILVSELLNYNV